MKIPGTVNAIIADRETGKTSFLYRLAEESINVDVPVMVIDSAVAHREKSLLCKLKQRFPHIYLTTPHDLDHQIPMSGEILASRPPFSHVNRHKLILVDASYFLEFGYETDDLKLREARRAMYKCFALQSVLFFSYYIHNSNKSLLIMDEIELTSGFCELIPALSLDGCSIWASLHQRVGLEPCEDFFCCYTLSDYALKSI